MGILLAVAALLAAGTLYQELSIRFGRRFPPGGCFVDVGGHRLHVVCSGEGEPVVLLESGIAASSLSWAKVQPEIATFTRVCAYDRAGLAWSDPSSSPRTFDRIVRELGAVLAAVAPGRRVVLVGHSFGSFVVRTHAARQPKTVAGVVLIDPPTEWLTMTDLRARLLRGGRHLSSIGAVLARVGVVRACLALLTGGAPGAPKRFVRIFGPTAARTLERLVGEVRKLPPDVHPVVQELWCRPKPFHSMAAHLRALERAGSAMGEEGPPGEVPVVVISAGDQSAEQVAAHRALAGGASAGRHVMAERCSHWVPFDDPDLIVSTVRELVQRDRETSAPGAADRSE